MASPDPDDGDLAGAIRRIWNENAWFWDERMGEGNDVHLTLVRPCVQRLLTVQPGERVLDVGCGNGLFARRLAALGASVVACDVSEGMLERPRARGDAGGRIVFRTVDATCEAAIDGLGAAAFDAAVANMVLMRIPTIEPLARALGRVLRPGARLVFAVSHPAFHTSGTRLAIEEEERDGRITAAPSVRVNRYASLRPAMGEAIRGQPVGSTTSTGRCPPSSPPSSRPVGRWTACSSPWRRRPTVSAVLRRCGMPTARCRPSWSPGCAPCPDVRNNPRAPGGRRLRWAGER